MSCLYKYTEHLQHNPSCSPYLGGVMELECTVEVPRNASDISIGWFLDCMELTNDSHITVLSQDEDEHRKPENQQNKPYTIT